MNSAAVEIYDILNFEERKFLKKISYLSLKKGYCWAGNDYFVKLFKVSERTIRNWLDKLKKLKYIVVKIIYGKKTQRRIMLCPDKKDCYNTATKIAGGLPVGCRRSVPGETHDKSDTMAKKSPKVLNKYNKYIYITSVFPTEKHNTCARTSERENYIAKKIDDKKRTPNGVLKVVEKRELSLKYNSMLEAQGARIHNTKGYIFNAPKSIDAERVSIDTLSTV